MYQENKHMYNSLAYVVNKSSVYDYLRKLKSTL